MRIRRGLFFGGPTGTNVAPLVIGLIGSANDYATRVRGVDEVECSILVVDVGDDAHMADTSADLSSVEEN